ncbi:hypothetical protein [Nonomuraea solani]|uniref:hypothetical protein n=1 Tax=Nonomuraea solani TaxID=1144553 RepID=UPI00190EFDE4|nr:hypothetical protein [Nonomuraea solani]
MAEQDTDLARIVVVRLRAWHERHNSSSMLFHSGNFHQNGPIVARSRVFVRELM